MQYGDLNGQSSVHDDPNELRKLTFGTGGGSSSCYYCGNNNISKRLSYEPTFTFLVDDGNKVIDARSWYSF